MVTLYPCPGSRWWKLIFMIWMPGGPALFLILTTFHIPCLHPEDLTESDLAKDFDVVIFPDNDKAILMTGKRKSGDSYYMGSYHPDYVKGIEKEGMEKLMSFSEQGGIIIAWGRSASLFEGLLKIKEKDSEEEFQLPFSDISPDLVQSRTLCAGKSGEGGFNQRSSADPWECPDKSASSPGEGRYSVPRYPCLIWTAGSSEAILKRMC